MITAGALKMQRRRLDEADMGKPEIGFKNLPEKF
jgi:hypothetical protein